MHVQVAQRDEWAARVVVTFSDDALRDAQRRTNGRWRALHDFLHEVPARQELNVETALSMAHARGMRWLLHLDADELFLPTSPGGTKGAHFDGDFIVDNAVCAHFRALDEAGIGHITYKNIEGVVEDLDPYEQEHAHDSNNNDLQLRISSAFERVCLFRQHFSDIPLTPQAMACVRQWCDRSPVGQYFLAYDNGKSAVRVLPGVSPRGVHSFVLPHETVAAGQDKTDNLGRRQVVVDETRGEHTADQSKEERPAAEQVADLSPRAASSFDRVPQLQGGGALTRASYIRDLRTNRGAAAAEPPILAVEGCVLHYVSCSYSQW